MTEQPKTQIPSYREIRAELLRRGTTLRKVALDRGLAVSTVYQAASQARNGKQSQAIREILIGLL